MGRFIDDSYDGFTYKLYIPSGVKKGEDKPLLVMLHGCEQNPADFAAGTQMNKLAEKEKFLVLYPDMNRMFDPSNPTNYNPLGCWNWFFDRNQHRGEGHPRLIKEMIDQIDRTYKVDFNRIFAVGFSAGAALACILGATYPDVFSGIGVCSGLAYNAANVYFLTDPTGKAAQYSMSEGVADPYDCGKVAYHEMGKFKRKMPVIVFHGICDTTVHPINGQQVIIQWAQTNYLVERGRGKADVTPSIVKADIVNGKSCTQHIYNDRYERPLMELWMIDQMDHAWSGGSRRGSYTDPLGPNATELIWEFFKRSNDGSSLKSEVVSIGVK